MIIEGVLLLDARPDLRAKYDPDQPRDDHGRFGEGDGFGGTRYVDPAALSTTQQQARDKYDSARTPTVEEAAAAQEKMAEKGASRYEANIRGNSATREKSRDALLKEFGDGKTAPCVYCGEKLTTDTVTRDKLYTAAEGGRYTRDNIVPARLGCNQERGDTPFGVIQWT